MSDSFSQDFPYPIGRFKFDGEITGEMRQSFLIINLPANNYYGKLQKDS